MRHETGTHRGLWGCPDAPTGSLSPEQDHEPRQASLVGTDGRIPGRERRAWPSTFWAQTSCPLPAVRLSCIFSNQTDRQTSPRRQPPPHPLPCPSAGCSHLYSCVCTALHLRQQTSYLYLSQKGAGASKPLPASCSWQHSNYFLSWVLPATGTLAGTT